VIWQDQDERKQPQAATAQQIPLHQTREREQENAAPWRMSDSEEMEEDKS